MTNKILNIFAALLVAGGTVVVTTANALADSPHLTVRSLVNNLNDNPDAGWVSNVDIKKGQRVQVYAELHNTQVGTVANNAKVKATLPANGSSSGNIQVSLTADNANSSASSVTVNAPGAVEYKYVAGSTRLTWNQDGQGTKEFENTQVSDGIVASGFTLGNQGGCNNFVAQISFLVDVVGPDASPSPSPSPSPSSSPKPSVSPSPTPGSGGQNQDQNQGQNQSQTQNNNQTTNVNVSNTNNNTNNVTVSMPKDKESKKTGVPVKSPETGLPIAASVAILGGAPVGLLLRKFKAGQVDPSDEESESEFITALVSQRKDKLS